MTMPGDELPTGAIGIPHSLAGSFHGAIDSMPRRKIAHFEMSGGKSNVLEAFFAEKRIWNRQSLSNVRPPAHNGRHPRPTATRSTGRRAP